ncbi:MAG TPA: Gfo/Idh/MocA family oxidoreductase [Puia sp.]|nr:Gfo/Idh/MocA family oxidoreductase [Puia sp.]
MKNYRWGIIGPGKIAAKFAAALPLAGRATLEAVASSNADRAKEFAAKFGAARSYTRYEDLAADPLIDAVYVATPHGFHAEHALLCLQQGKAVLCEKPMALSARQVQTMITAALENKAFLMEAMWSRFLPVIEKTLELIRDGQLGTVKYVRADFGFLAPFNPESRLYNLRLGGGSLLDIGIYPLFLCLLLLGEPDTIHAAGHLAPTGADETSQAILQYLDGRSAMISSTLACQTSITAEIAGTAGMIQLPTPWYKNDKLTLIRPGEEAQTFTVEPMVNGFEYQIREVTACLDKGLLESPRHSHADSLLLSRTMDAIREQVGVKYDF